MVKIGGAPSEDRWNKLSREELKTLSLEIILERRNIISDMDAKLELLTNESAIHEWQNLVSYFERKIKVLRECFSALFCGDLHIKEGFSLQRHSTTIQRVQQKDGVQRAIRTIKGRELST